MVFAECWGEVPKCDLCRKTDVECTYMRRYVTPSLLKPPTAKKHGQRERRRSGGAPPAVPLPVRVSPSPSEPVVIAGRENMLEESKSRLLQKRVDELELTVDGLRKELEVAKARSVARSPSVSSYSDDAYQATDELLESAFPGLALLDHPPQTQNPSGGGSEHGWPHDALLAGPARPLSNVASRHEEGASGGGNFDMPTSVSPLKHVTETIWFNDDQEMLKNDELLPDDQRDFLLQIFFDYCLRIPFATIHEASFWSRLRSNHPPSQILITAMCALASACGPAADGSRWPYTTHFLQESASRCEALLHSAVTMICFEQPSIEICQALVLLAWTYSFVHENRPSQEWLLLGLTKKMVRLLKLDVDPDVLEAQEASQRRWTCCYLDETDLITRETSAGIWKHKYLVKPISTLARWLSVDVPTGEPTAPDVPDATYPALAIHNIRCRIAELNHHYGTSFRSLIKSFNLTVNSSDGAPMPSFVSPPPPGPLDLAPDLQFSLLQSELDFWAAGLPDSIRSDTVRWDLPFSFRYDALDGVTPWATVHLSLYYHANIISLHRPRVMREIRAFAGHAAHASNPDGATGAQLSPECRESLRRCISSARAVTDMMRRRIHVQYPSPLEQQATRRSALSYCSPAEAMPLLEVGLYHLILLTLMSGEGWPLSDRIVAPDTGRVVAGLVGREVGMDAAEASKVGLVIAMKGLALVSVMRERVRFLCGFLDAAVRKSGLTDALSGVEVDIDV
ncbi:hypothetical protein HK101_005610 [Irineochytrium annulatum]|nr:hypothetical protein HK101_005610 [Irineochytrium annulatum]